MQEIAPAIAFVGILVFLAHFFTAAFSRTRIPDVLLLIIIGIFIGPVFNLVSTEQFGTVGIILTTITLIIILFESGTALDLLTLRKSLGGAMALAATSFFISMFAIAGVAYWFAGMELIPAFILGAIVGSISEAIVIPLIKQLKMRKDSQTILGIESSVNDVLSIVLTLALIEAYKLGEFQFAPVAGNLIASFLVAIVAGIVGAFFWAKLLKRIHAIKDAMFTTPAFVFIIFGIVEILGFNGAIAALAFGITLGNIESIRFYVFRKPQTTEASGLNHTERIFFSEVAFLLKTFFFVYLGLSLELISGWMIQMAIIFIALIFLLRIPAVRITVTRSIPVKDASIMAIMVPKGLAAAVLAAIPLQQGIAGGEFIRSMTYGVILLSIVMTSIMLLFLEKTKLAAVYAWIFSPHEASEFYRWIFLLPRPKLSSLTSFAGALPRPDLSRIRRLPAGTLSQSKKLLDSLGKTAPADKPKETKGILDIEKPGRKKRRR
ncbi:cation:proton antiporter [Chloroflexota bacterium]